MVNARLMVVCVAVLLAPWAGAADTPAPDSVNIPGSLQTALGCPGDWQPACADSMLTFDSEDGKWQGSFTLPAGDYEYKAALNGSWDENYGSGGQRNGSNIALSLAVAQQVKFIYDHETHWITDSANSTIATLAGDFQQQLGCSENWQPDCLRGWLQDADGDGFYTFTTTALSAGDYQFKVAIGESWDESYGNNGGNVAFSVLEDNQEVYFSFDAESKTVLVSGDGVPKGDLGTQRGHWLDAHTFAWDIEAGEGAVVQLHHSATASLRLGVDGVEGADGTIVLTPVEMPASAAETFPHLADYAAFALPDNFDIEQIIDQQWALALKDSEGKLLDATGVQRAGGLDDRYGYSGKLGALISAQQIDFRLWAPTARSVKVLLFSDPAHTVADATLPMSRNSETGVWSATTDPGWNRAYYLYEVEVYSYFSGQLEVNRVTDPYSLSLSINSGKSQIVNLDDADLKPAGWDQLQKPPLEKPEDIAIYELHVRDFSIRETELPENQRGTFAAFADGDTAGMAHLRELADAGLTHVHLLPAFDFATVNENRAQQQEPGDLGAYAADSTEQQAAVNAVRDSDGFNWGYDPLHYTVPEGSYSTDPNGTARILEFRTMVQSLAQSGLRLVMDVVYNHTSSYGQYSNSVLDKIVPGYYHRRNADGGIEMSSCCANTASEHAMMEKLMLDSLATWARAYKVDGFRFDLMGHHSLANILTAQQRLQALTVEEDGVDGSAIYLYGEGWNFGEVADDARFVQARQANLAGTGVGSFNDRLRDSVRGGNPFGGYREQGFGTGLWTDPNGLFGGEDEKATLLTLADKVRISLTGNLKDYVLIDSTGNEITGGELIYNGQPTGYVSDPQESINYIAAHDNETLFDTIQLKAPEETPLAERVRMQMFSNSLVLFAQGIPFIHAGQEFLRSKSLDRDSYNSGDWFNALDFTFSSSNWGHGLPIADKNEDNWDLMRPLLANPDLAPGEVEMLQASAVFLEQLQIRKSSPLFRLPDGDAVKQVVSFLNTGPEQIPGVIAMQLDDPNGRFDTEIQRILVLFNGDIAAHTLSFSGYQGGDYRLHPLQRNSADLRLAEAGYDSETGSFTVPARSTAVFVVARGDSNGGSQPDGEEDESDGHTGGGAIGILPLLTLLLLAGLRGRRRRV